MRRRTYSIGRFLASPETILSLRSIDQITSFSNEVTKKREGVLHRKELISHVRSHKPEEAGVRAKAMRRPQEPHDVAWQIPLVETHRVLQHGRHGLAHSQPDQLKREIDAGTDANLDASREPGIDFHQLHDPISRIFDKIAVCHSIPLHFFKKFAACFKNIGTFHRGI